ncbi:MAG: hypothetical protein K2O36_05070 [Ruminococcus sp.]|nr:hypothetical protein [Ruminococcus sp.]
MTDLYTFVDKYNNLKRDDFTECTLERLTIDDELPAISEVLLFSFLISVKTIP